VTTLICVSPSKADMRSGSSEWAQTRLPIGEGGRAGAGE
jgi:hypothetical protein